MARVPVWSRRPPSQVRRHAEKDGFEGTLSEECLKEAMQVWVQAWVVGDLAKNKMKGEYDVLG